MADWLEQPLWVLGNNPSLVTARHEKIMQENGPYIANGCMRSLRVLIPTEAAPNSRMIAPSVTG